jgi:predicted ATPase
LAELLRRGFGIDPADEDAQRLKTLERGLDDLGLARESAIPLLAALLDLPDSERYPPSALAPELRRVRTLELLVDWIACLADVQPLVLAVEDLHWCDDSTLEFIGLLIARLTELPLALVMTARPEFVPRWPADGPVQNVALDGLARPQVENMLAELSPGTALPPAVSARIVERAAGVPLFVEELARALQETHGLNADTIPGSLDSLLRARLDRLGHARELIQTAAVIGMESERPLLQKVSGLDDAALAAHLGRLTESGLLLSRGERHVFKHALIRDSAYATLLKSSVQKIHARTADAIESLYPGRLDERCGELAYHWERAGQNERAAHFAQRAGEQALRRSANTEAAVHLSTAIRLTEALPDSPAQQRKLMALYSTLGVTLTTLHGYTDSRALGAYQRALALARELGDTTELGPMMAGLGAYHMVAAEYAKAVEILQELTDLSVKLQMPIARIAATFLLGQTLFCMGRFREAVPVLEESLALYQRDAPADMALLFQEDSYSSAMATLAIIRWFLGFPERSAVESRASLQHARRVRHPFSLAIACNLNAYAHQLRGDVEGTIALANENIALSSAQNFQFYVAWSQLLLAWTEIESGKAEAAIAQVREASQIFNGNGAEFFRSWALLVLAEAQARAGRVEDALASIGHARDVAVRKDEGTYLAEIHRLRGEFLLRAGRAADEAESEFVRAIEIARAQAALSWELRAAMSLARLRLGQGRRAEALAILQPVYLRFTEGFDTPDLIAARTLLAERT